MLGNHSTTELSLVPCHVLPGMQGSHEDVMTVTQRCDDNDKQLGGFAEEQTKASEPCTSHLTSYFVVICQEDSANHCHCHEWK